MLMWLKYILCYKEQAEWRSQFITSGFIISKVEPKLRPWISVLISSIVDLFFIKDDET